MALSNSGDMKASASTRQDAQAVPRTASFGTFWAGLGALLFTVELYFLIKWAAGPNWKPVDPGPDVAPQWMLTAALWIQIISVTGFFACCYWFLIRPWLRERRVTSDGLLFIGFVTASPWDMLSNYAQSWFVYSSNLVNYGSVMAELPGIISYRAPGVNEAWQPLQVPFNYGMFVFIAMLGCWILRKLKETWPTISLGSMIAIMLLFTFGADAALENALLPFGFYTLAGGWPLFNAGKYYQYALHEGVFVAFTFTAIIFNRYYTNDKGETFAERGIDKLSVSAGYKILLRGFVAIAVVHASFLFLFHLPVGTFMAPNSFEWPQDIQSRSYLTNGLCGPHVDRACPGPNVPISKPGSPYMDYQGKMVSPNSIASPGRP
jgi:Spirocyclase AveC-like